MKYSSKQIDLLLKGRESRDGRGKRRREGDKKELCYMPVQLCNHHVLQTKL